MGDRLGWSIDDDRARLVATARRLGYDVGSNAFLRFARRQAVFQHNHFNALQPRWLESSHRLGLSYFHGRPGTQGYPEFDRAYEALRRNAARLDRVQVTHAEMHELVIDAGVAADKVFWRGAERLAVRDRLFPEGRCRHGRRPRAKVD